MSIQTKSRKNRCIAITKNGERCKNLTKGNQYYCWMHQPKFWHWVKKICQFGVLGFTIGLISFFADIKELGAFSIFQHSTMKGDFRIAISYFDIVGNECDNVIVEDISEGLYLRLEKNLEAINEQGLLITVWGPDKISKIKGKNDEDRVKQAMAIAADIDADMIVYGVITVDDDRLTISPAFYISSENFYEAQEIVGHHNLGASFSIPDNDNIASRFEINTEFETRITVLSNIAFSLAYYSLQDFEKASEILVSVEESDTWETMKGREVIYLLLGNYAGKQKKIDTAKEYFEKSLSVKPGYARAMIGLGSVMYFHSIHALDNNQPLTDEDINQLNESINWYKDALTAKEKPPLSDIDTKVHLGLGQCYFVLGISGYEDYFDRAINEFNMVIENYGNGENIRIDELAGEAYARLGLIYMIRGENEKSIEYYDLAINILNDNSDRQQVFRKRIELIMDTDLNSN